MILVKTIADLRLSSSINVSNNIDNFSPYIDEAEALFVKPILGDAAWNLLSDIANDGSSSGATDTAVEALGYARKAVALYALWCGAEELAVSVGAAGIQVAVNQNFKPVPSYQLINIKESWYRRANVYMEKCLQTLNSIGVNSALRDLLIGSETEFSKFVNIGGSLRVYMLVRPVIRTIEEKYIVPTITRELYDAIKLAYAGEESLSVEYTALLGLIQPAIAHLTMARALSEISIEKMDWGVFEMSNSTFTRITDRNTVNRDRIERMVQVNQREGESDLEAIKKYLNDNASATLYPEYFSSDLYHTQEEIATETEESQENKSKSGILFM